LTTAMAWPVRSYTQHVLECLCCLQIHSIAALFGVRAFQSQHPGRFHEKYHLTQLVKRPEAGILTLHGDMLVSHDVFASLACLYFPIALCGWFFTVFFSFFADLCTDLCTNVSPYSLPQNETGCWLLQVYFILELAELTKLSNKQGGEKYRREHKATLELANAVGRKAKGNGPNALTKGCVLRLQQLLHKGYLAVKRPKGDKQQHKPPLYPGDCLS